MMSIERGKESTFMTIRVMGRAVMPMRWRKEPLGRLRVKGTRVAVGLARKPHWRLLL